MEQIYYLTLDEAVKIHRATIEKSGGGDIGDLDLGRLDSVLTHIQNDDYYPTFIDKLVHLFFCSCKFHCFTDGNKRIAITLTADFLLRNGYIGKDPIGIHAPLGVLCTNDKGNAEHHSQHDAQLSTHTDAEYAENQQQRKGQRRSRDERNQHSLGNPVFVVRLHIQDSFFIECDFSHKPQPR